MNAGNAPLMFLLRICEWIDSSRWSAIMHRSSWMFPALDVIHTLGIVLVAGVILIVDLRLLGLGLRGATVQRVVARIVPATLWGFLLMLVSGALLFSSEAVKMYRSGFFRVKMILILLAGLNALVFHRTVYRDANGWDPAASPIRARIAGLLSLIFWIAIIAAGRAIAYAPGYDLD
ncbi:MAG TPA: DUF6644 family protein [Bryobacteraceae bacterium]|nr:DUF6644 family protein [Bryobacteraceae bacterium]